MIQLRTHGYAALCLLGVIPALVASRALADDQVADQEANKTFWQTRAQLTVDGLRVSLSQPVLVARRHDYLWFPSLIRVGDSDELLAMMSNYADEHTNTSIAMVSRSRDGGLTWESAFPARYSDSNVLVASGNRVLLPYYLYPRKGGMGGAYQVLRKGSEKIELVADGLTVTGWPRPDRSYEPKLGLSGFVFNGQTVRLRDGSYLATLYGNFEKDKRFSLVVARSTNGVNWNVVSTVADAKCPLKGAEGPCEAALCRLADGRLMCVFRLESGVPLGQTWSTDEGRSWTPAVAMDGPYSVQPSVAVLPSGAIVLSSGRPGIKVWINRDGSAREWREIDLVKHHNANRPADAVTFDQSTGSAAGGFAFTKIDGTSSYTETIALDDKHLLTIYDSIPPGWNRSPVPKDAKVPNSVWVVRLTIEQSKP